MVLKKILYKNFLCLCFLTLQCGDVPAQDTLENKKLAWGGFVDAYYSFRFGQPSNHEIASFLYNHNRHNEVNINLALVSLSYKDSTIRSNLGLMAGSYPHYNLAAEPELFRHIYEANAGVRLARAKEIWIDAGILPSHIGFETAVSKDCWTLTRSLLAENSPYYEAGVRASYQSPSQKWYVALLFLNGWQRIKRSEGNNRPSIGTQITLMLPGKLTVNGSSFIGNGNPDSISRLRYFHNFYCIFQLNNKIAITTGFDIGAEQRTGGSSKMNVWYSPVIIARYKTSDKLSFATRAEYYKDRYGVIIPTNTAGGFQTFGYSANIDYAIQQACVWRIEARTLHSSEKIFERRNTTSSVATWLTTSVSVSF